MILKMLIIKLWNFSSKKNAQVVNIAKPVAAKQHIEANVYHSGLFHFYQNQNYSNVFLFIIKIIFLKGEFVLNERLIFSKMY